MKKLLFILLSLVLIFSLVACGTPAENGNNDSVQIEEKNSSKISKSEFEALQTGMTYEEVVSIIGGEGEMLSQVDVAGYDTRIYNWKGEGTLGTNANVSFQNNALVSKSQIGLE